MEKWLYTVIITAECDKSCTYVPEVASVAVWYFFSAKYHVKVARKVCGRYLRIYFLLVLYDFQVESIQNRTSQ